MSCLLGILPLIANLLNISESLEQNLDQNRKYSSNLDPHSNGYLVPFSRKGGVTRDSTSASGLFKTTNRRTDKNETFILRNPVLCQKFRSDPGRHPPSLSKNREIFCSFTLRNRYLEVSNTHFFAACGGQK